MSQAPVTSITDEVVAELEREITRCRFDGDEDGPDDPCIAYSTLESLLSERASLLADARRYRWLRDVAELDQVSYWALCPGVHKHTERSAHMDSILDRQIAMSAK